MDVQRSTGSNITGRTHLPPWNADGYTHSANLSIPKYFASTLLQVINRIKTSSFEICDLTRSLAAEDNFSAPVSRLKNAMYISPKYEWLEG
jgi:hypothetical protein